MLTPSAHRGQRSCSLAKLTQCAMLGARGQRSLHGALTARGGLARLQALAMAGAIIQATLERAVCPTEALSATAGAVKARALTRAVGSAGGQRTIEVREARGALALPVVARTTARTCIWARPCAIEGRSTGSVCIGMGVRAWRCACMRGCREEERLHLAC